MTAPIQTQSEEVMSTRLAPSAQPLRATLTQPPNQLYMDIKPSHVEALQALRYTEAEARFLYIVATHSGYFTARQFLAFTGAHWGKRTTTFWNKLSSRQHARTECFPKGGVVHHVFSRRLYRQIKKENLRNRREHEFDFIKRCIAILDFVLLNQKCQYLETEAEKLRFFCETLNIQKHLLPSSLYLSSNNRVPTIRYFVDKFPMFVVPPSPVVTFTYVHEGAQRFSDFVRHLKRYLPLFRQLSEFRLVYASRADWQFEKATEIFNSFVKIPMESDIAEDLLRYFRVRKAWDEKKHRDVTEADLIFRNQARKRFVGDRFEGMYRGWKNGHISGGHIRYEVGINDRKHTVGFDTFLLPTGAAQAGSAGGGAERKDYTLHLSHSPDLHP
jgi:hypothetical protein